MRKVILCGLFAVIPLAFSQAQVGKVKVKVRAILVDADLNQKPVPRLSITITRKDGPEVSPVNLKTDFDGSAETTLPPGPYKLVTPQPVEFQGKRLSWEIEFTLSGAEQTVVLSNDNAKASEAPGSRALPAAADDLAALFKKYQDSVVTVWSEFGHGTGFFVDRSGLILTNQHVVGSSEYLAVQFDPQRKVEAVLLASDPQKDVAVLWANPAAFPESIAAPLAKTTTGEGSAVEGQRVFTIGSPLDQQKILTTGIVSKIEPHAIISDININPGNSGGPLFSMAGAVIGITTFSEKTDAGPGISGIVRIEEALPVLGQAKEKTKGASAPPAALLPVDPKDPYPADALKAVLQQPKFDNRPYFFSMGDYEVDVSTPPRDLWNREEERIKAERQREKRNKKKGETGQESPAAQEIVKNWSQIKPLIEITVFPKLKEGFWSGFNRSLAAQNGISAPAKLHFKTDFYRMRLLCGEKETKPILPGKFPFGGVRNSAVNVTDSAFVGDYMYGPEAIDPGCGQVRLEVYAGKTTEQPVARPLDAATVQRVWQDFEPYRKEESTSTPMAPAPQK